MHIKCSERRMHKNTHFSFSNLHCGFFNRGQIFSIPEFRSSFPLRSSSIRFEGFELNAEVRAAQPSAVKLLLFNLQRNKTDRKILQFVLATTTITIIYIYDCLLIICTVCKQHIKVNFALDDVECDICCTYKATLCVLTNLL